MKEFSAKERHQIILEYIKKNDYVDVNYLKDVLNVSEMTIRRDLTKLEEENKLIRVHGGAISRQKEMYEAPLKKRIKSNYREKDLIGKYAATLVEEGDVVLLDASSTVATMIKYLNISCTIITSNITVALDLVENENINVILLGGHLRKSALSLVGYETIDMLAKYNVDKVFLSSKAIDIEHGVSDATVEEAEVKKAMINSSKTIYFLMDSTKLNKCTFYNVCKIDKVYNLITNAPKELLKSQKKFINECIQNGVKIKVVN